MESKDQAIDILMIDDDTLRMESVVELLKRAGFNIEWVHFTEDAWTSLAREDRNFKLIVLDIIIPPKLLSETEIGDYDVPIEERGIEFLRDLRDPFYPYKTGDLNKLSQRKKVKDKYRNIPVTILTARNSSNILENLEQPPFCVLFTEKKVPFSIEEYAEKLRKALKKFEC